MQPPRWTTASLVIPAWDEADAIGAVLDEVPVGFFGSIYVVIASADDPTGAVAAARGAHVVVQARRGYGAACATGAEQALLGGAEVVAFIDGDYSDPPSELPRLLGPIQQGEADLVLGCRDLRGYPNALPWHARLGNRLTCTMLNLLLPVQFRDLPSCKAIRASTLRELQMQEMTYGWTVEMLVKAARRRRRIKQLDIAYRPRLGGRSKVAGSTRASLLAGYKLLSCALGYAT